MKIGVYPSRELFAARAERGPEIFQLEFGHRTFLRCCLVKEWPLQAVLNKLSRIQAEGVSVWDMLCILYPGRTDNVLDDFISRVVTGTLGIRLPIFHKQQQQQQ